MSGTASASTEMNVKKSKRARAFMSHLLSDGRWATLTHTHTHTQISSSCEARQAAGLASLLQRCRSAAGRAAAVGVCDERGREREQTDCEHDERAVQ
jgi:hypothetical protein